MMLDLQMPIKTGIQVLQEVRAIYKFHSHNLKIELVEPEWVFLTAFSTKAFRNYLKANNVKHCYEKPISLQVLKQIMDQS